MTHWLNWTFGEHAPWSRVGMIVCIAWAALCFAPFARVAVQDWLRGVRT